MPFPFCARPAFSCACGLGGRHAQLAPRREDEEKQEVEPELHRFEGTATSVESPYAPPSGKVFHSGIGGYGPGAAQAFGKHPAVYQYFVAWKSAQRDQSFMQRLLGYADAAGSRAMFHVSTKDTLLTPATIARGHGDGFLLAMNRMLGEHGRPTYLRLLSEMNNGANPNAAYDVNGRSRGRAFSTRAFKRAWRRAVLVIRGGEVTRVNSRLVRMGMPPLRTGASVLAPAAGGLPLGAAVVRQPRDRPQVGVSSSKFLGGE